MREALIDRGHSKMKRKEDCRAIEVCGKMQNVRKLCERGGLTVHETLTYAW
jgi:hypothetical protein